MQKISSNHMKESEIKIVSLDVHGLRGLSDNDFNTLVICGVALNEVNFLLKSIIFAGNIPDDAHAKQSEFAFVSQTIAVRILCGKLHELDIFLRNVGKNNAGLLKKDKIRDSIKTLKEVVNQKWFSIIRNKYGFHYDASRLSEVIDSSDVEEFRFTASNVGVNSIMSGSELVFSCALLSENSANMKESSEKLLENVKFASRAAIDICTFIIWELVNSNKIEYTIISKDNNVGPKLDNFWVPTFFS